MPVNSANSEYNENLSKWSRCRDVIGGSDDVKKARERYLPRLEGMSKAAYNAYLNRALFDNMTTRLLQGFSGIMTRRSPETDYPSGMAPYFEDVNMQGKSFHELFKLVTDEVFTTGRVPLLVDKGTDGGRAYVATNRCEQLINWAQSGSDPVSMAVLQETVTTSRANDPYALISTTQYRALRMTPAGYVVDLYRLPEGVTQPFNITNNGTIYRPSSQKIPELVGSYQPSIQGTSFDFIPLTVITPIGVDLDIVKPPILDIVDVNLSHYRSSADLEQGRHWVSLPTPIVSGVDGDTTLKVGSETAWILPDKDARAYYLEFQGQGLGSLEKALEEKQQQMVQFSSRLMDTATRGSEAADAVKLRNMSDSATLTSIAHSIEAGFNRVYKTIALWEGYNPNEVQITLNKDFVNTTLSAADITSLVNAFMEGGLDEETLVYNLKRGDILPTGKKTMKVVRGNPNEPEV